MSDEEILLHYSRRPLTRVRRIIKQTEPTFKPTGLWVSVGTAWAQACANMDIRKDELTYVTRIYLNLTEQHRILRLSGYSALDEFTDKYAADREELLRHHKDIDWLRVSKEYDGIIITPYQWGRRLQLFWYYSWDCASGCIWNPRVISKIERLTSEQILSLDNASKESEI